MTDNCMKKQPFIKQPGARHAAGWMAVHKGPVSLLSRFGAAVFATIFSASFIAAGGLIGETAWQLATRTGSAVAQQSTAQQLIGGASQQIQSQQNQRAGSARAANNELMDVGRVLGFSPRPGSITPGPEYLTLYDVIQALFNHNPKIRADRQSLAAAQAAIRGAEAEFLPVVSLNANVTRATAEALEDDEAEGIETGDWQSYTSNRLELVLQQQLYDFGFRQNVLEGAKADYRSKRAAFQSLIEEKITEVIGLYSELRRATMQYRSLRSYYSQALELFTVVKDRTDNDLAPQSELEYVRLQLAEVRQQIAQSESRIIQSRRAFEQEIGIWPQQLAAMPLIPVERISQLSTPESLISRSAQIEEVYAETDRRIADLRTSESQALPSVGLEVTGYREANASNSDATGYGADGVVSMSWTLFDGGRNAAGKEQALHQLRQSRFAADYIVERAKGDAMRRLIEVKQANAEIETVRAMIASSDRIIQHNVRLFQAGLVSATFMIGSLRERAFYRIRLVDLEHGRAVSGFGYALAMGILPEQLGIDIDILIDDLAPPAQGPGGTMQFASDLYQER